METTIVLTFKLWLLEFLASLHTAMVMECQTGLLLKMLEEKEKTPRDLGGCQR